MPWSHVNSLRSDMQVICWAITWAHKDAERTKDRKAGESEGAVSSLTKCPPLLFRSLNQNGTQYDESLGIYVAELLFIALCAD